MDLGQTFLSFFDSLSIIVIIFALLGLALIIAEFFQPMRKIAAVLGYGLYGFAVLLRVLQNGTAGMVFLMILFLCISIFISNIIMLKTQKKSWLNYTYTLQNSQVLKPQAYSNILGAIGKTSSRLDLSGQMIIDDINFNVTAVEVIEAGETVKVVEITNDKIIVQRVENADNA